MAPSPPSTRPRRRFGILAKMGAAFAVVAAMAVTSEVVAWLSFRGIETEMAVVVRQSVPAMSIAEVLAVEASAIAGASGTLATAVTEEERAALMTALAGRVTGLQKWLDGLARLKVDEGDVAALRQRTASLALNLERQSQLVARRIAVNTAIHTAATRLAGGHKDFLAAVVPRTEETYRALFAGIKGLVTNAKTGPEAGAESAAPVQDLTVLQRRVGYLFNHNVGQMLALLELEAAGNLAAGLLNEVILVTDPAQIPALRSRFAEVTISMGAIRLNLAATVENGAVLGLTTPILQYGLGVDNFFDQRLRELELISALEAVVHENRRLSEALTEAVGQLLTTARANAEQAARTVQADAAKARLLQTLAAVLAVLVALVIGWRYVGTNIIGRLLALQGAMEAEAEGRDLVIHVDGDDEIADMAAALGHFASRRKRAEAELSAAKERAEGAFRELRELQEVLVQAEKMAALGGLVSGVAHELNTPVGVCMTAASLLAERTDDLARGFEAGQLRKSTVKDFIAVASETSALIRANLERSADLIRVFKQVATEPAEDERQFFRVHEHVEMVVDMMGERLRHSGHTLIVECPRDLSMSAFPEALRQVIAVLLDNALTHAFSDGHAGEITVRVACPMPGTVTLLVADTGVGIQPEFRPRLFEPFFTTRRSQGGVGLGLHMVFNIVTSVLGGRITVESEPRQGSRFMVTMPGTSPMPIARRRKGIPWTDGARGPIEG